jgi:hypothetical protein
MRHQALMLNTSSWQTSAKCGTWDLSFKEIKKRASGQSSAGDVQAAHAAIVTNFTISFLFFYLHNTFPFESLSLL